jgi:EamA domain-containing membrane protein RarD
LRVEPAECRTAKAFTNTAGLRPRDGKKHGLISRTKSPRSPASTKKSRHRKRMRSWLFLFSCNLMWALQLTCIKLVQNQVGPLFTVWGPMTLATIMLYPLIRLEPREEGEQRQEKRRWLTYLALAGFGVVPGQVLMTWGTRSSLASDAAILNLTLPILTAFFAFLFLGERMTGVRWISFCIAIAGVLLCSGIDLKSLNFGKTYLFGNLLILGATFGSAFYNSYRKKMLEVDSPMRMLFYTYVATFILMTPSDDSDCALRGAQYVLKNSHIYCTDVDRIVPVNRVPQLSFYGSVFESAQASGCYASGPVKLSNYVFRRSDRRDMVRRAAHTRHDYGRNTGAHQHAAHYSLGRSQGSYRRLG